MRRAFTLIELLVVITIVSLLLAMTLPVIGLVRDAAGMVRCQQRASQIGHGLLGFTVDHQGFMPGDLPSTGVPTQTWTQLVKPYIDDHADPALPAPFFADPSLRKQSPLTLFWHSNYSLNLYATCRWDAATGNWGFGPIRLARIVGLSSTALVFGGMRVDGRVISEWHARTPGSDGQERFIFPHRQRRDSVLFADLHAEKQAFSDIPLPLDYATAMINDYWSMDN